MDLHDRAVDRNRLDSDAHDLFLLHLGEYPIQHAVLRPTVHAGVDRMPIAESFGQAAPFAALLRDVQDGVQDLQIAQRDVASLARQTICYAFLLRLVDFHSRFVHQ